MTVVFDMVASEFVEEDTDLRQEVSAIQPSADLPEVELALQPVVPDAAEPRGTSSKLPADLAYRYFFSK